MYSFCRHFYPKQIKNVNKKSSKKTKITSDRLNNQLIFDRLEIISLVKSIIFKIHLFHTK